MSLDNCKKLGGKVIAPLLAAAAISCVPAEVASKSPTGHIVNATKSAVSSAVNEGAKSRPRFDEYEEKLLAENGIRVEQANAFHVIFKAHDIVRLMNVLHVTPEQANAYARNETRFRGVDIAGHLSAGELTKGLIELNVPPEAAAKIPQNYRGGEVVAAMAQGVTIKELGDFAAAFPSIRGTAVLAFKKAGYAVSDINKFPPQFNIATRARFVARHITPQQAKNALQRWNALGMYHADYGDIVAVIEGRPLDME